MSTIHEQIQSIDSFAFPTWGARNFVKDGETKLQFDTSGMVRWKGRVVITVNASDFYDVRFVRLKKLEVVEDEVVEDVSVTNLVRVIDEKVA